MNGEYNTIQHLRVDSSFIASIIVGSSAYMFFVAEKKNQHLRWRFVMMVLLVNTIFTWVASEILRFKGWGELRGIVLILVALQVNGL